MERSLRNGELLKAAAEHFDAFLTVDQSLRYQQAADELPIAVLTLVSMSNKLEALAPMAPEVLKVLGAGVQKRVYVIQPPAPAVQA